MKKLYTIIGLAACTLAGVNAATIIDWDLVVSEDFSGTGAGNAITAYNTTASPNTSLTYARVSGGTGSSLTAIDSEKLGTAASLVSTSASSLTGLGCSGIDSFSAGKLSFDFNIVSSGTLFFALGDGSTFTSNSTFTGSHLSLGLQVSGSNLQNRSSGGAWSNLSTISLDTKYSLTMVFNNSGEEISYDGGNLLADGMADIWLGGVLISTVTLTSAMDATAFRIYTTSGSAEIANVQLYTYTPIPEPSTWLLLGAGVAFAVVVRRKRIN